MSGSRQVLTAGPAFKGVRNTSEPFSGSGALSFLQDALNGYIPDTLSGSGFYARSGFGLQNPSNPLSGKPQGGHSHVALDTGTVYNFVVSGGHIYRTDPAISTFTDVTPVSGVTIDSAASHVYFVSLGDTLIVSDGVNAPWIASNLGATNLTGVKIDYDGAGTAWSAFGQPVVYAGSVFFILNEVGGVGRRTDITWSAGGDPTTGYFQTDYDYTWTIEQTGSSPLYALAATNVALFYFRASSIGAITGTPNQDLASSSTHDAVSQDVGCLQSATIVQASGKIFFCDQVGRPWMMSLGGQPEPIWLAMRSVVERSTTDYPTAMQTVSRGVLEPNLGLYVVTIWSPVPGVAKAPMKAQVFDTKTGSYLGQWSVGGGVSIEAMCVLSDAAGHGSLVVMGSKDTPPTTNGYVWAQVAQVGAGIQITTENDVYLTMESGMSLTVENLLPSWTDNGMVPEIWAKSPKLGYSEDAYWFADRATVITGTNAPCSVAVETPSSVSTVEGIPSPSVSADGTNRLVVGCDIGGRGLSVKVSPTVVENQWSLQKVSVTAVASIATEEDA